MSFFTYKDKKLYYEEFGSGNPLLLLHGNTASSMMFAPIVPLLSENYHVIVLDFLGCGQSDRIDKWPEDLWYEWGIQAASLCQHLNLKDVNIIGSSGGALAAINIALSHENLVNAVVADSFEGIKADSALTRQIRVGRNYAKQNEGFCSMLQMMHGDDWERVLDLDTDAVIKHSDNIGDFFHFSLSNLKRRMLLVGSAEDEMFPEGHYERLFEKICLKTPYASCHIFEHGGHPAMQSNAEEFITLCENFFSEK